MPIDGIERTIERGRGMELKPCPFCGKGFVLERDPGGYICKHVGGTCILDGFKIRQGYQLTIRKWNRRAPEKPGNAIHEVMVKAAEQEATESKVESFRAYLEEQAEENDAWWLDGWIDERYEEWKMKETGA